MDFCTFVVLKSSSENLFAATNTCPSLMPPLCEDRLEVLVVWEAAVAHNDASSYVSQQMMANDEVLTNPIHDT